MYYARLEYPNNGYEIERIRLKALDRKKYYPVVSIDIGSSSTRIYLEGDKNAYNSVNFEFYTKHGDEYILEDIFEDPDLNPYLDDDDEEY
ncbi:hypothetical protein pEaSNUABM50_00467 [Erwinia phage pEa_SNUABM_50]|uniref:Uncharacterized protein n=4 Tax=Eneladusvirus BF TaxID=2560751 RepID=A0A7L8ZN68_9CAUD|nr:hypothetical protein FDH34_gp465 [Serratia phage BF]QOI71393.1 hypothetical protein pEaSNUABM12_00472 [Erwinia phage pEa_SNUABM_12]QOI71935.1 hypothetical protein pEaSNUABM47_00468 [Erwinia phage pEa_SNUABM_47]QOI72475.1 hypothetical protein pEaSNUABM50_00467 [Erwinia phage pEa_SNUABM_50]QXO11602.1 hypothetical protein pEaSNUABM19_00473 [Erwinia phage pEa_SNUABM_19]QXO12150.1 hypothetical protein pEaSNUABM44_00471 [Erwinia phage pEa_SNUABM_44]QXO12704.1 hypothetical protein pEaSNUABM49_004